jgi:hypothetical protein
MKSTNIYQEFTSPKHIEIFNIQSFEEIEAKYVLQFLKTKLKVKNFDYEALGYRYIYHAYHKNPSIYETYITKENKPLLPELLKLWLINDDMSKTRTSLFLHPNFWVVFIGTKLTILRHVKEIYPKIEDIVEYLKREYGVIVDKSKEIDNQTLDELYNIYKKLTPTKRSKEIQLLKFTPLTSSKHSLFFLLYFAIVIVVVHKLYFVDTPSIQVTDNQIHKSDAYSNMLPFVEILNKEKLIVSTIKSSSSKIEAVVLSKKSKTINKLTTNYKRVKLKSLNFNESTKHYEAKVIYRK